MKHMKQRYRWIMGKHAVQELLASAPERIVEVHTCEKGEGFVDALRKEKIPLRKASKEQLSRLVHSDSHQNVVAAVREPGIPSLATFLKEQQEQRVSLVLMLDSIQDPHNFGAILRAAECFGVDGVVFSKNRGVGVTPVVSKVSAGATELVPLLRVANLVETAKRFRQSGYLLLSAEAKEGATSLYDFSFPSHTLIILGSEGKGIQPLLRKTVDTALAIPMQGKIDSLNVSQATAVLLASYRREHPLQK